MTELYKPVIVKKEIDDAHYYYVDDVFVPAVTTILHETLPTPIALRTWIGDMGNEKAQVKLEKAADRGSALHDACARLLSGKEVKLMEEFPERQDKKALVGFINWFADFQPKAIHGTFPEMTVASRHGYAGTLDFMCTIQNKPYIIDFKTSKAGLYDSYKLQLGAYRQAVLEMTGIPCYTAVLHLNPLVKKGYSFYNDDKMVINKKKVEITDFLAVLHLYKVLHGGVIPEPPIVDKYPEILKLETEKIAEPVSEKH